MSLSKKVARVVRERILCTWVDVQAVMPDLGEMKIRRALMNASAHGYVLMEQQGKGPAVYSPNPAWHDVESATPKMTTRSKPKGEILTKKSTPKKERPMSLHGKIADVVELLYERIGRKVNWVDVQQHMPHLTENQVRRALMNATYQKMILVDTSRQRQPGKCRPEPAFYHPNPNRQLVGRKGPVTKAKVSKRIPIEVDEDLKPLISPDAVVASAMQNRHHLDCVWSQR